MQNPRININELLTDIYSSILTIEETNLRQSAFSDVTIKEIHTIKAIGLHQKQTMGEIAKRLHITAGTLTVAIKQLVKKDYVRRLAATEDRRIVRIALTKKGRVLLRAYNMFHTQTTQKSLEGLTETEVNVLESALTKVHQFLKAQVTKKETGGQFV